MSKLASQLFMIAMIGFMAIFFVYTADMPAQSEVFSALALLTIGLSLGLERIRPYERRWNQNRGDLNGDIASFALIFVVLDGLLKYLAPLLALALLGGTITSPVGLWLREVPLWVEILAVTLLIELAAYLSHWVHHRSRHLWALHAMHHSIERLYTLNNFRFHPLNHMINAFAIVMPPLLLGFSEAAIFGYVVLTMPVLVLQHANVDFQFGWLNRLLNTNEVHRWHHSADSRHGGRNLGRALTVWDQLFGTFLDPQSARKTQINLGLGDNNAMRFPDPGRLVAQWRYPFSAACCQR